MSKNELGPIQAKREAFNELTVGSDINCDVNFLIDGEVDRWPLKDRILEVHDGGFYGRVLALEKNPNVVIKLTQPDPWHEFWRLINWRGAFPPQTSKIAAQHDHLSTRIISEILPYVTDGAVSSPKSYGYTFFDKLGYAQVLERMSGRPPRFDLSENEVGLITQTQHALLEVGTELGLEQVGQIHPDNPFAFANLWIDEFRGIIWLDTLPAFRHTSFVAPFFHFGFHEDIRERLGGGDITFNKIHTERFRNRLEQYRSSIPKDLLESLYEDLATYDEIAALIENEKQSDRSTFISSCLECGLLNQSQAEDLLNSHVRYARFIAELTAEPLIEVVSRFITTRAPIRLLRDEDFRNSLYITLRQVIKDPDFRMEFINNKYALAGINEAYREGFFSEEEITEMKKVVESASFNSSDQRKKAIVYANLQVSYLISSWILNAIEASSYLSAFFVDNPKSAIATGVFTGWVLPSIVRPIITKAAQELSGVDLRGAIIASVAPKVGGYWAIPINLSLTAGSEFPEIWHYTLRRAVARLSALLKPWGGWGTQHEAELWNSLEEKGYLR